MRAIVEVRTFTECAALAPVAILFHRSECRAFGNTSACLTIEVISIDRREVSMTERTTPPRERTIEDCRDPRNGR